jgi:hypothetical protein
MIHVNLSVRDAIKLLCMCETGCGMPQPQIAQALIKALEVATGEADARVRVEALGRARFVDLVRVVRSYTGWGLGDAKRWSDVVRGNPSVRHGHPHLAVPGVFGAVYDDRGEYCTYSAGQPNELELPADKARELLAELHKVGVAATFVA